MKIYELKKTTFKYSFIICEFEHALTDSQFYCRKIPLIMNSSC